MVQARAFILFLICLVVGAAQAQTLDSINVTSVAVAGTQTAIQYVVDLDKPAGGAGIPVTVTLKDPTGTAVATQAITINGWSYDSASVQKPIEATALPSGTYKLEAVSAAKTVSTQVVLGQEIGTRPKSNRISRFEITSLSNSGTMPRGVTSYVRLEQVSASTGDRYSLRFIMTNKTGRVVAASQINVAPGDATATFDLRLVLPDGDYNATVYRTTDPTDISTRTIVLGAGAQPETSVEGHIGAAVKVQADADANVVKYVIEAERAGLAVLWITNSKGMVGTPWHIALRGGSQYRSRAGFRVPGPGRYVLNITMGPGHLLKVPFRTGR